MCGGGCVLCVGVGLVYWTGRTQREPTIQNPRTGFWAVTTTTTGRVVLAATLSNAEEDGEGFPRRYPGDMPVLTLYKGLRGVSGFHQPKGPRSHAPSRFGLKALCISIWFSGDGG